MKRFALLKSLLLFLLALIGFIGCADKQVRVQREDLIELNLGVMEDEIDYFDNGTARFADPISFVNVNGFLTISNGALGKIMRFSNLGDLLMLIYTPKLNPLFGTPTPAGMMAHEFTALGLITVDKRGYIYAEDKTLASVGSDGPGTALRNRIVKVFDDAGRYSHYLGREGRGGSEFSLIHSLTVAENGTLMVLTRSIDVWELFWFSPEGILLGRSQPLNDSSLPAPDETILPSESVVRYIVDIKPDTNALRLFVNVGANILSNVNEDDDEPNYETALYLYDLESQTFTGRVSVPTDSKTPYDFLGVDKHRNLYFYTPIPLANRHLLTIMSQEDDQSFKVIKQLLLTLPGEHLPLKTFFHLSSEGIISSLFLTETQAKVVWWRVDKLIPSGLSTE
jgi:hypothetical protein